MAAKKKSTTKSTKTQDVVADTTAAATSKPPSKAAKKTEAPAESGTVRIPTSSGLQVEMPTEAPQHGALTGSPSWMPPGGPDVAAPTPGVPQLGTPAADPRGTPKASSPGPLSPSSDEPTQDLSALRDAVTSPATAGEEVVLTFARGAEEPRARAEREKAVLKTGTRIRVRYLRQPQDLGQAGGRPVRIEVGYRFDGLAVGMATVADGQSTREGALVRREPVLRVPPEARQELQLWFRVDLEDGRTVWDSLYGQNHRFKVQG